MIVKYAKNKKLSLLVDSAGQESAIDYQGLSRDERSGVGSQIHSSTGDFAGLPEAPHRSTHQQFVATGRSLQQFLVELGTENTWSDGVDQHTVPRPFDCERAGQRNNRRFTGRVGRHLR